MMMAVNIEFELRHCPECGIHHYVPTAYMEECRRDPNQWFHCPAGHRRHFVESEADKLRRERDRLQQRLASKDDEIRDLENQRRAAQGQITKLKKRAAAGTCPCCQRTFSNMAEHMKRQHPEYVEATGAKVVPIKRKSA